MSEFGVNVQLDLHRYPRISAIKWKIDFCAKGFYGRTTLNHKSPSRVDGWMGNV